MPPRLSPQTITLLLAMAADFDRDHYGLELMKRAGLHSGTLYPALIRLETHGLVTSSWEDIDPVAAGRPRRRLYRLTGDGIRLTEQLQQGSAGKGVTARA
ncbi:PadR family transcriptional regulator [Deinococcus rufus]|uniref:PadR family transcriptional regulator n=1 Tax=Deinococcus rufus TaxID=2136097 RepID=A0ABV7Z7S8_9DEIO